MASTHHQPFSVASSDPSQYSLHFCRRSPPPPTHLPLLYHADRPQDFWVLHPRSFSELLEAAALGAQPPFDTAGRRAGPVLLGLSLSGVYAVENARRRSLHKVLGAIDDSGRFLALHNDCHWL
jgi:hypothetical protein